MEAKGGWGDIAFRENDPRPLLFLLGSVTLKATNTVTRVKRVGGP